MDANLTPSDIALLSNRNDGFVGDGGWLWLILIFAMMGGGGFGYGNRGAIGPNPVTSTELQSTIAAQSQANQLQNIAVETANNNYETAQLINQQMMNVTNMNNTNQINVIQGFNAVQQAIANQTNIMGSKMDQMSAQMEQCCCSIKTQMLQDRLSDTQAALVTAQNQISNANQSQYLLGQMGRWVGWTGAGSATTSPATSVTG